MRVNDAMVEAALHGADYIPNDDNRIWMRAALTAALAEMWRPIDTNDACAKIGSMWESLGEQIAAAIPDIVIEGKPQDAIRWAQCAEACFWQATGESTAHDVNDVIAVPTPSTEG